MASPAVKTPERQRAQLIHIETDRRLGHEWDEWDGKPLPQSGDFSAPPRLFFVFAGLTLIVAFGVLAAALYLLAPRIGQVAHDAPRVLWVTLALAAVVAGVWYALAVVSHVIKVNLLPERLLERGPFLRLMNLTSYVARVVGNRDRVEHAGIDAYNAYALRRGRKFGRGELLVLIPRCLSKETLDGVLGIAGRYDVPVFVATRGQLARRAIRERRPRAVVAVACERDMTTGLRDVAGKLPVLGLTMRLPNGPCRDAVVDLPLMEDWVRSWVGETSRKGV
jgi:hypothetical protein